MDSISTYLLTQGPLGAAVLVLGFVIRKLYSSVETLQKEKIEIMEARRVDTIQTLEKVTDVMQTNSETNRLLVEKIEAGKQSAGSRRQ